MRSAAYLTLRRALPWGLATLLLVTAQAQAQWKWRDKDGRVTASDLPPPRDIPDRDILSRPNVDPKRAAPPPAPTASTASAPEAGKSALEREVDARKRAAELEQSAKDKAQAEKLAAQRAENCRRARGHQAALESGQRIARTNEKGEREVLDDRGRAEEMRRANEVIAADCKP